MAFLIGFLIVILVLVSILLVLIILAQDDGAEGAGMLLGSSASQQYGARKGNIVTKATGILATLFVSISLLLVFLFRENDNSLQAIESKVSDDTENQLVEWWAQEEDASDETAEDSEIVTEGEGTEVKDIVENDAVNNTDKSVITDEKTEQEDAIIDSTNTNTSTEIDSN